MKLIKTKSLSALALVLPLLGGSMLMGAGAANASQCPTGQHWNEMGGGAGFCSPDASGGGTGGSITVDLGGQPNGPDPVAPDFPAPAPYVPPRYGNVPAAPIVVPPAPVQVKAPVQQAVAPVRPAAPPAVAPAPGNAAPAVSAPKASVPEAAKAPVGEPAAVPSDSPSPAPTSASPSATPSSAAAVPVVTSSSPSPSETSAPTEMKFGPASSAGKIDSRTVGVVVWLGSGALVAAGAYLFIRIAGKRKASEN